MCRCPGGFQQTHEFQTADSIAHRASADAKQLRQFTFRGEQVTRREILCDAPFELLGDFLIDLASRNRFESQRRCFSVRHGRWSDD